AVPERGAAVDADARNAEDREVDGEHVPLPAGREVARRAVDGVDGRVGEGGRVEARRFLRVMVVPEADGVRGMPGHGLLLGDDRGRLLAPRRKKDACPRPPSRTWACGAPPSSASRSPPRCRGAPRSWPAGGPGGTRTRAGRGDPGCCARPCAWTRAGWRSRSRGIRRTPGTGRRTGTAGPAPTTGVASPS